MIVDERKIGLYWSIKCVRKRYHYWDSPYQDDCKERRPKFYPSFCIIRSVISHPIVDTRENGSRIDCYNHILLGWVITKRVIMSDWRVITKEDRRGEERVNERRDDTRHTWRDMTRRWRDKIRTYGDKEMQGWWTYDWCVIIKIANRGSYWRIVVIIEIVW